MTRSLLPVRFVDGTVWDAIGDPAGYLRRAEALGYLPWPFADEGAGVFTVCPYCGAVGRVRWIAPEPTWPTWTYNGHPEAPTLSPSVLMRRCGFHCWVRDGEIVDAGTPPHGTGAIADAEEGGAP